MAVSTAAFGWLRYGRSRPAGVVPLTAAFVVIGVSGLAAGVLASLAMLGDFRFGLTLLIAVALMPLLGSVVAKALGLLSA